MIQRGPRRLFSPRQQTLDSPPLLATINLVDRACQGLISVRVEPYPQAQVTSGLINGQHRRGLCNTAGAHILVGESMLLHLTMDCCSYIDTTQMNRKELENNPGGHEIFDAVRVVF